MLDIRIKILAKKPHVLRMDINANNTGFKDCHSKVALDDYVANNPTATYEFRNKVMDPSGNGVYEANPVIKKRIANMYWFMQKEHTKKEQALTTG